MMFKEYHLSNKAEIITTSVPGKKSVDLLKLQGRLESNNVIYPSSIPIALEEGKGSILKDVDGNLYIDFISGCGVFNFGYNNPYILDKINKKKNILTQIIDFPSRIRIEYIQKLFEFLPSTLAGNCKINFGGPSGSDAVETAIKLAQIATGRRGIIAFQGGYHGMTMGALSVSSKVYHRNKNFNLLPSVSFVPYCSPYRCLFNKDNNDCDDNCIKCFQNCLENPHSGIEKPASIIVEPIQGEGGTYIPKIGWLEKIVSIAHDNGVLVIFDEIQAGFFRTGTLFSFQHTGALPDIIVMSKSIGGNGYPFSLIIFREELDKLTPGIHIGTFRGNQLAMTAGSAALDFVREFNLIDYISKAGNRILTHLKDIFQNHSFIGDVRGIGMMFGVEYVKSRVSKEPFSEMASKVRKRCYEKGLLVEIGGYYNNVIRFLPALTITNEIIDNGLSIFEEANSFVEKEIST